MTSQEYHRWFVQACDEIASITKSEITFREIDERECYLKAVLTLVSGHALHIAEYVVLHTDGVERLKYRNQLLDANNIRLMRWDNAPHHSRIETFPHHRHNATGSVHPSRAMTPIDAVVAALDIIDNSTR